MLCFIMYIMEATLCAKYTSELYLSYEICCDDRLRLTLIIKPPINQKKTACMTLNTL